MDADAYRKKIELDILQTIEQHLKDRKMNAARAKEIAQYMLETLHPHMDINQIYAVAQDFDKHFPELISVVAEVIKDYDEKIKKTVTDHVQTLIQQGEIDEANDLLKKALNRELQVS